MTQDSAVRCSLGKTDTSKPRYFFPLEYSDPDNHFWNDLPFTVGRKLLHNSSAEEIDGLRSDPNSTLEKRSKLELLAQLLRSLLASRDTAAAPETFFDGNIVGWDSLWLGIYTIQAGLGDSKSEEVIHMLCERNKELVAPAYSFSSIFKRGEYAEAEEKETGLMVGLVGIIHRR